MELTVATWVFVIAFTALTLLSVQDDRKKLNTLDRFKRYMRLDTGERDRRRIDRSFQQRIIQPLINRVNAVIHTSASETALENMRLKLLNAGYPMRMTPAEFFIKQAAVVLVITTGVTIALVLQKMDPPRIVSFAVLTLMLVSLFMFLLLREKVTKRVALLERELPELLDYIQVAVEAGLSIDSAIERIVAEQGDGIMAYEFKLYLNDVKMGLTRSDALHQLTLRTACKYVKGFTDGIIQAVKTGMPLGSILQIIRRDIYDDIRSRAEKRAYKAPVLMMIPMVIFIFPTVFVITLTPAALKLMSGLSAMSGK